MSTCHNQLHIRVADYPTFLIALPPEKFHPDMEGYVVEVAGVALPIKLSPRPRYPYLEVCRPDGSVEATLVILGVRVYRPGNPVSGWLSWLAPRVQSMVVNTDFDHVDEAEDKAIRQRLRLIRRNFRRGCPVGSGLYPTRKDLLAAVRRAIAELQAWNLDITQVAVATKLGLSREYLSRELRTHNSSWKAIKRFWKARKP